MVNGHEFNDSATHYWSNLSAIPHRYLYEGMKGIRRGMWSVSWFKEVMGPPWAEKAKPRAERGAAAGAGGPSGARGQRRPDYRPGISLPQRHALPQGHDDRL